MGDLSLGEHETQATVIIRTNQPAEATPTIVQKSTGSPTVGGFVDVALFEQAVQGTRGHDVGAGKEQADKYDITELTSA